MKSCDHYGTLGIGRMASDDDVRLAYRRLARRFHPDVTDDIDGERKFKAVGEAYKALRRADSRSAYNRQLVGSAALPDGDAWIAFPPDLGFALFPWPFLTWLWWN